MKTNFVETITDALDDDYLGKFPKSARASLEQMRLMIRDSDSPADVALALSVGMAFVLCSSNNPEKTLAIMLEASGHLADKLMETVEIEPAGKRFYEKLDNMKKGNLQ